MLAALFVTLADAPDPAKAPSPAFDSLIFLFAPIVLFIFFIVMPMRRDARVRKQLLAQLKKNDRVLINGFLIGTVMQIIDKPQSEGELLVKVDENANIKMRVLRSSVTRIFPSDEPAKDTKEGS